MFGVPGTHVDLPTSPFLDGIEQGFVPGAHFIRFCRLLYLGLILLELLEDVLLHALHLEQRNQHKASSVR